MSEPEVKSWIYSASCVGALSIVCLMNLLGALSGLALPIIPRFISEILSIAIFLHVALFVLLFAAGILIIKGRASGLVLSLIICLAILILLIAVGIVYLPIFVFLLIGTPFPVLSLITIAYNISSLRKSVDHEIMSFRRFLAIASNFGLGAFMLFSLMSLWDLLFLSSGGETSSIFFATIILLPLSSALLLISSNQLMKTSEEDVSKKKVLAFNLGSMILLLALLAIAYQNPPSMAILTHFNSMIIPFIILAMCLVLAIPTRMEYYGVEGIETSRFHRKPWETAIPIDEEKMGDASVIRKMIYCRYCGRRIPADSVYCTYCGRRLR